MESIPILSKEENEDLEALRLIREYGLVSLDPLDHSSYRDIAVRCGLVQAPEFAVEQNKEITVE